MESSCDSTVPFNILHSIDDKIEELFKEIALLKRQRNFNVPVFCLPTEILSTIFLYVVIGGQDTYAFSSKWISITYVCHFWREVALHSPSLWSCWGIPNSQWIETFSSRSAQAPLYIRTMEQKDIFTEPFVELLRRSNCRDRARELHISGTASFLTEVLYAFDHCQASDDSANSISECLVRSVSVESSSINPPGCRLPRAFQSLRFPHLQRIELVNCISDWNSTIFESAVLVHLSHGWHYRPGQGHAISDLLSVLAKQPLLEELIIDNLSDIHTEPIDLLLSVDLPHLRFIYLYGATSSCFTLLTKISYPRTQICIQLTVTSHSEQDFALYGVPFFSEHYGDNGNRDGCPVIRHFSVKHHSLGRHLILRLLCAPNSKPPGRPSLHEPSFRLMVFYPYANIITAVTKAALAVLPLHNVCNLVYSGKMLDHAIWRSSMFNNMSNLEEMKVFGASVGEAVLALNSADDRRSATCDEVLEDAEHQVNFPVQRQGPDGVTISAEDSGNKSKSTEKDEPTPPILLPKLKTLRIVDADFRCNTLSNLAPLLESRKLANKELELLSLVTCRFIGSYQVGEYSKLVKKVIWDWSLDYDSDAENSDGSGLVLSVYDEEDEDDYQSG